METQWKQNSAKQTRLWLWALSAHCLTSYWSASSALAVTHVWFPSDTLTVVGLFSCLGDGFPAQLPLRNSINGNCYLFTCNTAGHDCDCGPILTMRSTCARSVLRHNYFQYLTTDPNQQKGQSVRPDSFAPLTSKQTAGAVFFKNHYTYFIQGNRGMFMLASQKTFKTHSRLNCRFQSKTTLYFIMCLSQLKTHQEINGGRWEREREKKRCGSLTSPGWFLGVFEFAWRSNKVRGMADTLAQ